MHKDENGYIVVETIGTFVPFILLVVSILSLVNIVALQARVHYALTQAANTLSMYSYTLEVLGIANDMTALDNKAYSAAREANAIRDDVNMVLGTLDSFTQNGASNIGGSSSTRRAPSRDEDTAGGPQGALGLLMNYGLNELRSQAFEELARPLIGRYLANGALAGDEYLTKAGVINKRTGASGLDALEFYQFSNLGLGNSALIDRNGNVKLVVEYEVKYTFGGLPLPFDPTLRITQTAVTKAWLNGSGKGYW